MAEPIFIKHKKTYGKTQFSDKNRIKSVHSFGTYNYRGRIRSIPY